MTYLFAILSALLIGISKGGLKGMGAIFVLFMALAFGGKTSVGIVVPLLIVGDIMGFQAYKKHVSYYHLKQFLPWVLVGVVIGALIGNDLSDTHFKQIIAGIILLSMGFLAIRDLYLKKDIKLNLSIVGTTGLGAGIFTMLGNLAGAFSNFYLLATRLPKKEMIGTSTLIFLIVNLFKLPFHIFLWKTINLSTLTIVVKLLPLVFLGFWIGLKIVDRVSDAWFRKFLYVVTILSTLFILIK